MAELRITEYNASLAAGVADMWNKSAEGWNGMVTTRTADMIIREHNNAHHLHVFLALDGEEVIGYCSLDKYTQDEGALYVNTLNVRPDYHGQKVGKMLVLACVEKTVELGWPRVDLYTWAGNTKAVPLYKKCGFFWEKRDETTHLMNYIPTVIKTEALAYFFEEVDWYCDSRRVIEVKPDGRKENKFDYFEYLWEKDGKNLRVEFERTGRGMRLIETDDYRISATVEDHELVFGMDYAITYDIVNKSGNPLTVELFGKDNKNISFSMEKKVEVADQTVLKGSFRVKPVTEEQKPGRTHPCVTTELLINGEKALFKTGIAPVYPANMKLYAPGPECWLKKESVCIMELENKIKEEAVITFTLKDCDGIEFPYPGYAVALKPLERKTLDIPYILTRFIFYSANTSVTATLKNGTTIPFKKRFDVAFKGRSGILWGDSEEFAEIYNGPYRVHLNKQDNFMWMARIYGDEFNPFWIFPKIGQPFSSELSNRKPDEVEFYREDDCAVMKAVYKLNDWPGIKLSIIACLDGSGILQHHYEVKNLSHNETTQELCLSDTFRQDLFRAVLPYDNIFVELEDYTEGTPAYWNSDRLTENWFFSRGSTQTRGVCWHPDQAIQFDGWGMYFEYTLGRIAPRQIIATKPVTVAVSVFENWQDFRMYALKKSQYEKPSALKQTLLDINNGNPFVEDDFGVALKDFRTLGAEPELVLSRGSGKNPDLVTAQVESDSFSLQYQSVIFRKGNNPILTGVIENEAGKLLYVDNGILKMKASGEFYWGLHSLEYQGSEWFDTAYPAPGMKSWWNPWFGGVALNLGGMSGASLLEETREASFGSLTDEVGNTWQGIKMAVSIDKNEKFKGMKLESWFVTMPGVPVVCCTVKISQTTGRHLEWQGIELECFLKTDDQIRHNWVEFDSHDGNRVRMRAGKDQHYIATRQPMMFSSPNRREKLLMVANTDRSKISAGINNTLLMGFVEYWKEMRSQESFFTPPVFLVFSEEYLPGKCLNALKNIKFIPKE